MERLIEALICTAAVTPLVLVVLIGGRLLPEIHPTRWV